MTRYELTNTQRKYFGLVPIQSNWEKEILGEKVVVYFENNKITKIINYDYAYLEYDTDIDTIERKILVPKTSRGKEQKLSVAKLLKIKGCGTQFSISFFGGGITVYDNRRNLFFIKSTFEEGEIRNFEDANNWIANFINNCSFDYIDMLDRELSQKRVLQDARPGDIISFKIGQKEFGFARILKGILKKKDFDLTNLLTNYRIHPRSLTVAPYAHISDNINIDLDDLITKPTLPSIYIFDNEVYYGEMPILGHRPLSEEELDIPPPQKVSTSVTIFYTKTDILKFKETGRV